MIKNIRFHVDTWTESFTKNICRKEEGQGNLKITGKMTSMK